MPPLKLTYGPDAIFSKTADPVILFDKALGELAQDMVEVLYREAAVGLGANMVGVLQRIIVIDLQETGVKSPQIFINPEISQKSDETQCHTEASICFPGVSAKITRPLRITLSYQDTTGVRHYLEAEDYLATVIQHEVDYLNGVIFLDYLSAIKRKMLLKKTVKYQKQNGFS